MSDHVCLSSELLAHGKGELLRLGARALLFAALWSHCFGRCPPRCLLVDHSVWSWSWRGLCWKVVHRDSVLHQLLESLLSGFP